MMRSAGNENRSGEMNRLLQRGFYPAVLILLAFSIYLIRMDGYALKRCVYHDEGVSYLCAAGKQGLYYNERSSEVHPSNRWAKTDEWKEFYAIERPFDFKTIRTDLIVNDVHPPLYFWTLHTFGYFFGIDAKTGPALNTVLHVLTFFVFFMLLTALTSDRPAIVATLALWTLSPSVIGVTFVARQYELCTLLFLTSLLLFVKIVTTKGPLGYLSVGLSLALFLGILSHYQFIYVFGVVGLLALVSFWFGWITSKKMLGLVGTVILSFGLFIVAQPVFFEHIQKIDDWKQPDSFPKLLERLNMVAIELYQFLAVNQGGNLLSVTVLLVTLSLLARLTVTAARDGRRQQFLVMLAFWLIAGLIIGQYLTFYSPWHAMEDRYLALVWPLWSLMLVLLVASLPGAAFKSTALGAIVVSMVVVGYVQHDKIHYLCRGSAPYLDLMSQHDTYLVDAPHWGRMPKIMLNFDGGKEIYVATQRELLSDSDRWMNHLRTREHALYISMLGYDNDRQKRDRILDLLEGRFEVREVQEGRYAGYALTRK
jgi:hypothetical protein